MRKIILFTLVLIFFCFCGKKSVNVPVRPITIEKRESEHQEEVKMQESSSFSSVNSSLDTLTVEQSDGTSIDLVGKGNRIVSYAETTDGYTIVRNSMKVYDYAKLSEEGALVSSGIKARNVGHRSKYELKYLKDIKKHLRYEGEKLKELLKRSSLKEKSNEDQ